MHHQTVLPDGARIHGLHAVAWGTKQHMVVAVYGDRFVRVHPLRWRLDACVC